MDDEWRQFLREFAKARAEEVAREAQIERNKPFVALLDDWMEATEPEPEPLVPWWRYVVTLFGWIEKP